MYKMINYHQSFSSSGHARSLRRSRLSVMSSSSDDEQQTTRVESVVMNNNLDDGEGDSQPQKVGGESSRLSIEKSKLVGQHDQRPSVLGVDGDDLEAAELLLFLNNGGLYVDVMDQSPRRTLIMEDGVGDHDHNINDKTVSKYYGRRKFLKGSSSSAGPSKFIDGDVDVRRRHTEVARGKKRKISSIYADAPPSTAIMDHRSAAPLPNYLLPFKKRRSARLPYYNNYSSRDPPTAAAIDSCRDIVVVNDYHHSLRSSDKGSRRLIIHPLPIDMTESRVLGLMESANIAPADRFKIIRKKFQHFSGRTINPSTHTQKLYFQYEEKLRFDSPWVPFAYTARDGEKSTVAPLLSHQPKKTTAEAIVYRNSNPFLKPLRPSWVTFLSLVRDAASRLPGAIGTRDDICLLLRDSIYLMDGIPDKQLGELVSSALYRLRHEVDPCVRHSSKWKAWRYLHRDRGLVDGFAENCKQTTIWQKKSHHRNRWDV